MRVLAIDMGNSRCRAVLWEGEPEALAPGAGAGGRTPRPFPGSLAQAGEWPSPGEAAGRAALADELARMRMEQGAGALVLCSVVPDCDAALAAAAPDLVRADHTARLPFTVEVADMGAVGADRYCNLAAAAGAGWRDALVVDAGTATTFDLLLDGCFRGGLIAPGMAFAAQKLGETAARLRPAPFAPCPLEIGADTAAAMQAGAYHVGINGILGTVDGLLKRYGRRPVVFTGGLGHLLAGRGRWHDPLWTLRGALTLASGELTRRKS